MSNTPAPQDDKPELKDHLAKNGIKMQEKKGKKKGAGAVSQIDTNVKVGGSSHPNSGSSYNGIFGY
jgi:hypothetical protein